MQTKDSNSRTSGAVNHPGADEWVAFLYGELPAATRRELGAHLAQCPNCAAQLQDWRDSMNALDQWALPAVRRPARQAVPALKWAAAAAVILLLGFAIGRQSSSAAREIAALKASVAQLEQNARRETDSDPNGTVDAATAAANDETVRLLAEFSRLQNEQRIADRLAVQALEIRLDRVRSELETVALNTESGFQQTHENLVQLASLSVPTSASEPK